MPHCENCKNEWSWAMTLRKSFFTLGEGMECPECGKTQYLTKKSRKNTSILNCFLAPILIISGMLIDMEILTVIVFALVLFTIMMAVYPYMVELADENEPMW